MSSSYSSSSSSLKRVGSDAQSSPKKKIKEEPAGGGPADGQPGGCPPPLTFVPTGFNALRGRLLTPAVDFDPSGKDGSCVVLWMSRDQRSVDNHALIYAQGLANQRNVPLKVVFNLVPKFLDATLRSFHFMLKGLEEVEKNLRDLGIPFYLLKGDPTVTVPGFIQDHDAAAIVCDFASVRVPIMWTSSVATTMNQRNVPMIQIDAHNVVPCFHASPKLEYSARTIRSKINALLPQFLNDDMPALAPNATQAAALHGVEKVDWTGALKSLEIDRSVKEVDWLQPGTAAAWEMYRTFCDTRLSLYAAKRNDPNLHVCSDMSPYFKFGQFSVQRAILHIKSLRKSPESTASYVEEALVRRELSDNFCFYNPNYDNLNGIYPWARESLNLHKADTRSPLYTKDQFERAETYDDLWNAAQFQMVQTGKMHGFLRMYWAKKILEWSESPETALEIAIYLNDKYSLDGRDPNGYVGCMWSIGGIHDQGWAERSIFGKIRYMNYAGCKRKFDVAKFVKRYPPAATNATRAAAAVTNGGAGSSTMLNFLKVEKK
jgi:deoxyribodipyrimidine photo-lyase